MSSTGEWMVIQTLVCPHHGIVFSNEKEQIVNTCDDLHRSPGHYAEGKKPVSKGYAHCVIPLRQYFSKLQNSRDEAQVSGRLWRERRRGCGYRGKYP